MTGIVLSQGEKKFPMLLASQRERVEIMRLLCSADSSVESGTPFALRLRALAACAAQRPILSQLMADPKFKNLVYFVVDFHNQKDAASRLPWAAHRQKEKTMTDLRTNSRPFTLAARGVHV